MLLVGHDRHRHEFRCRPGAGIAGSDPFRAAVRQMGHAKLGQCVGLPLQLAGPAAVAERHLHLLAAVACAFLVRACERKGRNILHAKRSFAAVSQGCPAADDRNTGKELDMLNRPKPGNRVFKGNFKLAAALAGRIAVSVIHHAQARIRSAVRPSVIFRPVLARQLDLQQTEPRFILILNAAFCIREGAKMQQTDIPFVDFQLQMQPVLGNADSFAHVCVQPFAM
ncbi:hypothetical protein D3C71_1327080 [compost metagenome]